MNKLRIILIGILTAYSSQAPEEFEEKTFEDISTRIHSIELSDQVVQRIGDIGRNALYCEEQEGRSKVSNATFLYGSSC